MPPNSAITAALRARRKGVAPNQPLVPGNALKTALPPPSVGQGRPLPPPGPLALPKDKRPDFASVYNKPAGDINALRGFKKDRKALVGELVGPNRSALQKAQGASAEELQNLIAQNNSVNLGHSEGTAYTPEQEAAFAASQTKLKDVLAARRGFLETKYDNAPRSRASAVSAAMKSGASVEPMPFRRPPVKGSVPKVAGNVPAPSNPTYGKQGPSFPGAVPGAYARTTRPGGGSGGYGDHGAGPIVRLPNGTFVIQKHHNPNPSLHPPRNARTTRPGGSATGGSGSDSPGAPNYQQIQHHIRSGNPVRAPSEDYLPVKAANSLVNHGWTYNGQTNQWVPPRSSARVHRPGGTKNTALPIGYYADPGNGPAGHPIRHHR